MGLDQYAFAINKSSKDLIERFNNGESDFTPEEKSKIEKGQLLLAQWRKHPNLQQWVIDHFGLNHDFNGSSDVYFSKEDLDMLEEAVLKDDLPLGVGFFWGVSTPEDKKTDLRFIKNARKALKDGFDVTYECSW